MHLLSIAARLRHIKSMKKYISLLLAVYLASTLLFLGLQQQKILDFSPKPRQYTIKITSNGFSPDELTIRKNDIVDFINEDTSAHWPASNPHPIHDIYSQFDPRTVIQPHQTWSFTVGRVGEWHYHDHLVPYHTGVITVKK
jgi:hypothetical protein